MATKGIKLSDKAYNVTKQAAQIVLPAVATLYFALAQIWGLGNADKVVGSITAFDTFLGVLLGLSTAAYNASDAKYDGSMIVEQKADGKKVYSLELDSDPADLDQKKDVTFKVK